MDGARDTTSVLRLQNRYSAMEALADWLQDVGRSHGLAEGVVQDLNLALEEVVTNVISYAYSDDAEHEILLRATRRGDQLEVEVEDDGREFDPLAVPPPDLAKPLEEREIGGLGIHLVRSAMDAVKYRRAGNRNVLLLVKRTAA